MLLRCERVSKGIMAGQTAVIVVNYGTASLTISAVESVLSRVHGGRDVRIHLVDNASPEGDAEILRAAHHDRRWDERVTLWLEESNHGFGRGNNVVLTALAEQEVPPEKVFLLNPDARLENEAIAILAKELDQNPRVGAVGASVLRPNLTPVTAAFRFPGFRSEIARIINFGPIDRIFANYRVPLPPDHPAGPVDWLSGASVMFRFEAIRTLGFFDPKFFLYYEEVDLMRRLGAAGWGVVYAPAAQVVHEEGAATGQFAGKAGRKRDPGYLYDSWSHYFVKALGRPAAVLLAICLWPAALMNVLHCRLRGREPTIPLRFFRDHGRLVIARLLSGRFQK